MNKHKCSACGRVIVGKIRIVTYRKTIGRKSLSVVDYYDEKCFKLRNKERCSNGSNIKKRTSKKKT